MPVFLKVLSCFLLGIFFIRKGAVTKTVAVLFTKQVSVPKSGNCLRNKCLFSKAAQLTKQVSVYESGLVYETSVCL